MLGVEKNPTKNEKEYDNENYPVYIVKRYRT